MLSDNAAMRRLLDAFAVKLSERDFGSGIVELVYAIKDPSA
jgi:hypothetical protein